MRLHLIHYGADTYDPAKFKPVQNRNHVKPYGGLWASPVNAEYGWREWCLGEDFQVESLDQSFTFWYEGNVLIVNSHADMAKMYWRRVGSMDYPDYERMVRGGVDAIYLTDRGQQETRYSFPLGTRDLYGWDCESVLIMNPEEIKEVTL